MPGRSGWRLKGWGHLHGAGCVRELSKAGMPRMDAAVSCFPGKAPRQGLSATETMREGKNSSLGRKVLRNQVAISQHCA